MTHLICPTLLTLFQWFEQIQFSKPKFLSDFAESRSRREGGGRETEEEKETDGCTFQEKEAGVSEIHTSYLCNRIFMKMTHFHR